MFRTQIEIFTPHSFGRIPRRPEDGYMAEDVTESVIQQIIEEKLIKRVQISDYIPNTVLEKLNRIFISRPDISFRVYGGADKTFGYGNDFNGWNLDFLRFVPDVQNIVIDGFEYKNTDLSILSSLSNIKSLKLEIYDLRDFTFVKTLPSLLEHLYIDADLKSGKPVFDCQWLLHLKNLQSLFLGKLDKNLEVIVGLSQLEKLELRAIKNKDLSFLKQMSIKDLSILWCDSSKIDLTVLSDFRSLRQLKLFRISKLDDISFVSTLIGLKKLELIWLANITKMPNLANLNELAEVYIDTLNRLVDISSLVNAKKLRKVVMLGVKSMTKESVYAVLDNPNVEELRCFGGKSEISDIQINRKNKE
ncbi:leucine-rich repeat domain-containing protein [Phocaeicola sartorii]|uniref:Leucine-rich repeat domain-containing protein n=1 Tax=Phocaeicola sartorii TaxID=671267 RepID=R9HZ12_9BACT|nr:hypothetical protein [Phocaeicola sartorii]EOS09174.1 hypothetical protein C802_03919 [Phocaeicola sartorii]MCR1846915.1 hypothetical protein [Phocaeicola sartorii]